MPRLRMVAGSRLCIWFCPSWLAPCLFILLATQTVAALDVPYSVDIAGIEDEELRERTVEELSVLFKETERPPPTLAALRRRANLI